jgi:soluble cytochrome b562
LLKLLLREAKLWQKIQKSGKILRILNKNKMAGVDGTTSFAEGDDAMTPAQDAVMNALENPRSVGRAPEDPEVEGLREGFEAEAMDAFEGTSAGAEIFPFPSTAQTPDAQAEYAQATLVSPEAANAGMEDLDMRLAS